MISIKAIYLSILTSMKRRRIHSLSEADTFLVLLYFHMCPIADVRCLSICYQNMHSSVTYSNLNLYILVYLLRNSLK